jgi:hypothetical protein
MNWRWAIGISLLLNLGLGIGIILSKKQPPLAIQTESASPVEQVTGTETEPVLPPASPAPTGLSLRWEQLANADLKIYRDQLIAVGCPDATVREIIRAEINHRFAPRRTAIVAAFQPRAWGFLVRGELALSRMLPQTEWGQSLMALSEERRKLIADVLGGDHSDPEAEQRSRHENLMRQLSWLPAEKRDRLIALEEQYQRDMMNWAGSLVNGAPAPEDKDRPEKLLQALEQAKQQLLTPDELAELQLRESNEANWAGNLSGFDPTEDEWRAVTQLQLKQAGDQSQLADPDLSNEQRTALQNGMQADFDQALEAALGSDRYAQYQLANNAEFQAVRDVTQRYGLPDDIAAQAYQAQKDAMAAAEQVRNSQDLSPDARQAALTAIQQETERNLAQILGPDVMPTYKEYRGDWITGLSQAN